MAGIGDELLLLFIALGHRTDNAVGQNQQQHQHRQQAQQGQCHTGQQSRAEGGQAPPAVQENDAGGVPFLRQYQIAIIVQEAAGVTRFKRRLGIQFRRRLIHSGDLTGVRLDDLAVLIQVHREKAGLVRGLRGQPLRTQEIPFTRPSIHRNLAIRQVLCVMNFGKCAIITSQQRKYRVSVGDHLLIAHQVDSAQNHGKDDGQGDHAGGNELAAQSFDHGRSSRE